MTTAPQAENGSTTGCVPVTVSKRIEAPANVIFGFLADPARHEDFDGSEMLRGVASGSVITGVGDTFVMRMHYSEFGDYEMLNRVVEFEPNRRIAWAPVRHDVDDDDDWGHRWGYELVSDGQGATIVTEIYDCSRSPEDARRILKNGTTWLRSMASSLERLDALCSGSRPAA